MENIMLGEIGQKLTENEVKTIIDKIDGLSPKVEVIDWNIFDAVLHNADFTKTTNSLDALKKFYESLWIHVVFPHEEEAHLKNRENGRLIVENYTLRKKTEDLEKEITSLREELQGVCEETIKSL